MTALLRNRSGIERRLFPVIIGCYAIRAAGLFHCRQMFQPNLSWMSVSKRERHQDGGENNDKK